MEKVYELIDNVPVWKGFPYNTTPHGEEYSGYTFASPKFGRIVIN